VHLAPVIRRMRPSCSPPCMRNLSSAAEAPSSREGASGDVGVAGMVFVGGVEGAVALRPLGHLGCRPPFVKKNVPPEYPAVSLPPAHSADVGQILCIRRHDLPIIGRR